MLRAQRNPLRAELARARMPEADAARVEDPERRSAMRRSARIAKRAHLRGARHQSAEARAA